MNSDIALFKHTFRQTNILFFEILKRSQRSLIALTIIMASLFIYLSSLEINRYAPINDYFKTMLIGLAGMLLFFLLRFLIWVRTSDCIQDQENTPFMSALKGYIMPLTKHNIRSHMYTTLWSLLLFIPGWLKSIWFLFTPYVVLFDPRCESQSRFDPLQESQSLLKGLTIKVVLTLLLMFFSTALIATLPIFIFNSLIGLMPIHLADNSTFQITLMILAPSLFFLTLAAGYIYYSIFFLILYLKRRQDLFPNTEFKKECRLYKLKQTQQQI